jgi:hypothetical protein
MIRKKARRRVLAAVPLAFLISVGNVVAQNGQEVPEICDNQLVSAMDNLITLLAAIGPVIGALVAMASMLVLTTTQNPRKKKKWINTRNDAIKYGVGILFVGAIMNLLVQVTSPDMASCVNVLG